MYGFFWNVDFLVSDLYFGESVFSDEETLYV